MPVAAPKPKSKGYVFISYADEDADFVVELKLFLKKQGYGYWDYRESERDYQVDYTLELEDIIKNAAGTLSVVSPNWKRSKTAFQELHYSREVKTPVFLLKVNIRAHACDLRYDCMLISCTSVRMDLRSSMAKCNAKASRE